MRSLRALLIALVLVPLLGGPADAQESARAASSGGV
jgi:hypothetical protein